MCFDFCLGQPNPNPGWDRKARKPVVSPLWDCGWLRLSLGQAIVDKVEEAQWCYLDLYHLKRCCKFKQPRAVPGCPEMGKGSCLNVRSWPHPPIRFQAAQRPACHLPVICLSSNVEMVQKCVRALFQYFWAVATVLGCSLPLTVKQLRAPEILINLYRGGLFQHTQ